MEYLEFIEELKKQLADSRKFDKADMTVYMEGYAGTDDTERAFIQKINHEVCGDDSDVLTEDYIRIRLDSPDNKYCFMSLGLLYDIFNEQGWEGVLELIDKDTLFMMDGPDSKF